jgi:hypothetical protein
MNPQIIHDIERLETMTVSELRAYHQTAFGEPTLSRHRTWLIRRIAWKLQEREEGGLSERALARAAELAKGLNLRERRPSTKVSTTPALQTKVVPLPTYRVESLVPGTTLRRDYQGRTILAKVLDAGFECDGVVYRSLSALASTVTGTRWNGHAFFGLRKDKGAA